jgi:hypothetical protein
MSRTRLFAALLAGSCILAVGFVFASRYRAVEVETGNIVECLDPRHPGDRTLRSSLVTLRVASKDAGSYGVTVESVVCDKCQARADAEAEEARKRKRKEDAFIDALRKHDDAVLLCCRRIAGTAESSPYGLSSRTRSDISRLRALALSGKQLCAPQSLSSVEFNYGKSMDEILLSLPYIERGIRNNDIEAMTTAQIHMLLSKSYRDKAIAGIEGK